MKIAARRIPSIPGFQCAGISCGIKAGKTKDLALIVSDRPAVAAGVFTTNQVQSPTVAWDKKALQTSATLRAILVNSGNANACTGKRGMKDCEILTGELAKSLSISSREILIASTGIIGVPLPAKKIVASLDRLTGQLSKDNWKETAQAIMTTDLVPKTDAVSYTRAGKKIIIGGIAKGSGMIHPNMATMLAFITTNAALPSTTLQRALKEAVDPTFNSITVDGDTSTNDMVLAMASGLAGNPSIWFGSADYKSFVKGLKEVCKNLAFQIVQDGEGATKFVTIKVQGAKTKKGAQTIAKSVATSSLVKTALFGEDPNWGRVLSAVGYAGVSVNQDRIRITLNGALLFKNGAPARGISPAMLRKKMRQKFILVTISLFQGRHEAEVYTCDLSYNYVRINAEYTT